MEKITDFQKIIIDTLSEYQSQFEPVSNGVRNEIVVDEKNHHYQFLWTGWRGDRYVFSVVFHIDIQNGKIWVQKDNSEIGVANLLVEKGVAKKDIVLGYFPEAHRQFTEFAEA